MRNYHLTLQTIIWIFLLSFPTFAAKQQGATDFKGDVSIITGKSFTIGSTQWDTGDGINGEVISNDTIDDDSIDFVDVTLTDLTFDVGNVSTTEFGYLDGVTSAIQTQIGNITEESSTAGRSLTLSTYDISADAELYTDDRGGWFETPAVEQMAGLIPPFMSAVTITYFYCKTDAGTVTLNIEDGSDNNILSSDIVCDVGGQTSCASGCDVNTINGTYDNITAKTEDVDMDISAVSSATEISFMIGYTKDD